MLLLKIILIFTVSCFAIQNAYAIGLAFGGPFGGRYSYRYIEGFRTINATHWGDKALNVMFYLLMSVAYFSCKSVYNRYGYVKTIIIVLFAQITIALTGLGVVLPFLAYLGVFDFLDT